MSTPANAAPAPKPPRSGNAAARYFFLFLIGLAVGIVATVMALRALDARKDHYPESVMHVMSAHIGALAGNVKQNRCSATDILPHLQALRMMANDIEPAFGDLREDQRFAAHAADLRASLDEALASPPISCPSLQAAVESVGGNCKACHQEFRN
ncbi:MAG TPA: hypothetical protein VFK18_06070 [Luteimonas sp.]|nr:hypothetical protein [Luteimonas sp.]